MASPKAIERVQRRLVIRLGDEQDGGAHDRSHQSGKEEAF